MAEVPSMFIDHGFPRKAWAPARLAALALFVSPGPVFAQWTVTNLHPIGATESECFGIGPGPGGAVQQAGYATFAGTAHALLWSSSPAGFADLHPTGPAAAGVTQSIATGVSGTQQCGTVYFNTLTNAALWTGAAASWQNLNQPAIPFQPVPISLGSAIQNGVVVGAAGTSSGTGSSTGAARWDSGVLTVLPGTTANGIDAPSIVGSIRTGSFPFFGSNATLWTHNPPAAPVATSLHSSGLYGSIANAVSGNQQVGTGVLTNIAGPSHAYLWTGNATSGIDLNPSGASGSEAFAVSAGTQAGNAKFLIPAVDPSNPVARAGIWTGTAASWVNLHAFLPATFRESFARGIYKTATNTYVVGYGSNTATNRYEALLWSRANCVPAGAGTLASASACSGAATFTAAPTGSAPFTYTWFWMIPGQTPSVPVMDGPNFFPSTFEPAFTASGANTASVTISGMGPTFQQPGPPRQFRVAVSNECGGGSTTFATLNFTQTCPADFDCSGGLAIADIFAFLNGWFAGIPAADFDHINGLQVADIFAFLNAWFAGC